MAPWLHQLLGVPNSGLAVELVVWGLLALSGGVLLVREARADRSLRDNPLAWAVGGAATIAGLGLGVRAAFGTLTFGEQGLHIPSYGAFMALAFAVAIGLAVAEAKRRRLALDSERVLDLVFWILMGGLLGARLLGMVADLPSASAVCWGPAKDGAQCAAIFNPLRGSVVFYGGVIGALATSAVWCRRAGVPFWRAADQVAPFLAVGHAVGRIGCVAAGCCFGAECAPGFPLGIAYPVGSPAWMAHYPGLDPASELSFAASRAVHPTALYEAFAELVLFAVLLRMRRAEVRPGASFGVWLVGYAVVRIVLEAFRGDAVRGHLAELRAPTIARGLGLPEDTVLALSTSQVVGAVALGVGLWLVLRRSHASPDAGP